MNDYQKNDDIYCYTGTPEGVAKLEETVRSVAYGLVMFQGSLEHEALQTAILACCATATMNGVAVDFSQETKDTIDCDESSANKRGCLTIMHGGVSDE